MTKARTAATRPGFDQELKGAQLLMLLKVMVRRAIRLAMLCVQRIWILQIASSIALAGCFAALWQLTGAHPLSGQSSATGTAAILPVLAITNTIPVAAAASFLSRFNANDRTTDSLAVLAKTVAAQANRLDGHPRKNPFMRRSLYRSVLARPSTRGYIFRVPGVDMLFTPRPYWDGVWYYGSDEIPELGEHAPQLYRSNHELVYCAWRVLRVIDKMRVRKLTLLFRNGRGGTQGSRWFLESFDKNLALIRQNQLSTLTAGEGEYLVMLAMSSWHYASEELREYRGVANRDEYREARFGNIFCEYITWLNYFQLKGILSRRLSIVIGRTLRPDILKNIAFSENSIGVLKREIDKLRPTFLARIAVAGRISRIRAGAIFPIVITTLALGCHLALLPIMQSNSFSSVASFVALAAYALSGTAVIGNLAFGLWLLLPELSAE